MATYLMTAMFTGAVVVARYTVLSEADAILAPHYVVLRKFKQSSRPQWVQKGQWVSSLGKRRLYNGTGGEGKIIYRSSFTFYSADLQSPILSLDQPFNVLFHNGGWCKYSLSRATRGILPR